MAKRRRPTPARWLAPLALVTCAVAVYAVVDNTLSDDSSQGTSTAQQTTRTKTTSNGDGKSKRKRRTYIVKSGDTLSAISVKTGVPLATIERLNPRLDAQTLRAGQKVRLAR